MTTLRTLIGACSRLVYFRLPLLRGGPPGTHYAARPPYTHTLQVVGDTADCHVGPPSPPNGGAGTLRPRLHSQHEPLSTLRRAAIAGSDLPLAAVVQRHGRISYFRDSLQVSGTSFTRTRPAAPSPSPSHLHLHLHLHLHSHLHLHLYLHSTPPLAHLVQPRPCLRAVAKTFVLTSIPTAIYACQIQGGV